jgi:hypothetical protein
VNLTLDDLWREDDVDRELLNINEIPHGGVEHEWWHTYFVSPWGCDGGGVARWCGARQ